MAVAKKKAAKKKTASKRAPAKRKSTRPEGRPSAYNLKVAEKICSRISAGESLNSIVHDPKMPSSSMVYRWLDKYVEFREKYARAKEEQADKMVDEIISLADEPPRTYVDAAGIEHIDNAGVTWQKNRVDARKWVAAKLKPQKYGDKLTVAGDEKKPLIHHCTFTVVDGPGRERSDDSA